MRMVATASWVMLAVDWKALTFVHENGGHCILGNAGGGLEDADRLQVLQQLSVAGVH